MRSVAIIIGLALLQKVSCQFPFTTPMEHTNWLVDTLMQQQNTSKQQTGNGTQLDLGLRLQGRPQILLLGDSITGFGFVSGGPEGDAAKYGFSPDYRGWALMLNDTLQNQAHIQNLAFAAGDNSQTFKQRLSALVEQIKPIAHEVALLNIAFGLNDAIIGKSGCGSEWYTTVDNYLSTLKEAVPILKAAGVQHIMLTTPTPQGFRHTTAPDRMTCFTEVYMRGIPRQVAPFVKTPVANIFDAIMAVPDWQKTALIGDGLHLSALGNKIMHDTFLKDVKERYNHLTPEGLTAWYSKVNNSSKPL